jgi:Carboxypeptidase regulatory-like domain
MKNVRRAVLGPILAALAVAVGLVLGLMFAQTAMGDELYGRIRGVVTDSSGAVLPGAELKLLNVGMGTRQVLTSDSDGNFEFVNLKPGIYKLTAAKSGFKVFEVGSIHVEANSIYVQNVVMDIGTLSEVVEVNANPAQVEQTSMQLTATIDSKTITDLPLLNRNWINLQQTLPGVVTPDTRFNTAFSTNGSQAQQNSFLTNGNDSNDLPLNTPLTPPNPDAIEEVKMVTNTINPEFGRNSGAILNAITKSGTNSFHGTAFEFYRDTFMNSQGYFQTSRQIYHQHQFGGTVGGPILKNKLFFFFSTQAIRARQPDINFVGNPTVFTGAQLNGSFNPALLTTNPIPFPGGIQGPSGHCNQGTAWNACFVGGAVPTSDFNPLSVQLVQKFVPSPSINGNQVALNPVTSTKNNQYIGRLDYTINQKDSIWFYAYANDTSQINTLPFIPPPACCSLPGFGDQSTPFTKQFTASWNHVFTPNVLNEFRVGYSRLNFLTGVPVNVRQPASVGFPNIIPQLASGADYPQINITGYFILGGTSNGPQPRKDQTYQITDNFSWVKGRHSLKFGYDGRKFQVWNPFANSNEGVFLYGGSGSFTTGDPGLDFLLGVPDSYTQGSGSIIIDHAYEHYLYAQDQWRIRNNLTLTFGAGYQIDTPIEEFQNNGISRVCFQPGVQSTVFPTAPVGYTLSGDRGCDKKGGASTHYDHIGPRVGFAYTPDWGRLTGGAGKTSIRGGFGIYYNRSEGELNLQDLSIAPFGLTTQGVTTASTLTTTYAPSFPNPFQDISSAFSIPNPFPYVPPGAGAKNIDFTQFEPFGFNLNTIPKNFTAPYSMNFNLTVERELPGKMILRIGYVGAQGRDLITSYTFNPITPAGLQACLADPTCTTARGRANLPISHPSYYPYDGSIWGNPGQQTNQGYSNYNSLQVVVDKRLSHGLQFLSAYTWSHSLDVSSSFEDTAFQTGGGLDPYGRFGRDYGSSAFDARHRWSLTLSYDVPSLKHLWSAIPGRLVEGWRLTGLNALQTGFPVNLQDSSNRSLTCDIFQSYYSCPDRPNLVFKPQTLDPRTAQFKCAGTPPVCKNHYWFDPGAFSHNTIGTLGNVGRASLYGPGYWNADFSVQKDTKITEGKTLQLRLEAFNVFNHTNFANPNGDVNSSNFGRISAIRLLTQPRVAQLGAKFIF